MTLSTPTYKCSSTPGVAALQGRHLHHVLRHMLLFPIRLIFHTCMLMSMLLWPPNQLPICNTDLQTQTCSCALNKICRDVVSKHVYFDCLKFLSHHMLEDQEKLKTAACE
jgi:hypothetical protein